MSNHIDRGAGGPDKPATAWYEQVKARYDESPIHHAFGLSMEAITDGFVKIQLECPAGFRNAHGTIAGGVLTTALDSAILQAVRSQTPGVFTQWSIELKVNYIRPAVHDIVRVEATALHVGGRTGVAQAIAYTGDGQTVAAALGTIHIDRRDQTRR